MKILVIQQKMIGDVLTSTILFEKLRERYPDAKLYYLINSHTKPVVEHNPFIDELILFTPELEKRKRLFYRFLKSIKSEQFDIVIDVYSKLSSNLITSFSGAKTKISYHKHYSTWMYHHNIKRLNKTTSNAGLAIVNRLQLLTPLNISPSEVTPKLYLTPSETEGAKALLQAHGITKERPLVMISVLGSGTNKTYPHRYMAHVIDTIVKQTKTTILFNYIPKQLDDAKNIYDLCDSRTQEHIKFEVFGKSLREFLALLNECDAIIGNEGGAINMAKALQVKTFAIYAPWISKATWSIFEDGIVNDSVHLEEYHPEAYSNVKQPKALLPKVEAYYDMFKPLLFQDKLNAFLQHLQ